MLVRGLRGFLAVATRIGSDPLDSPEERLRKALLVIVSLMILPPGIVWGILYWSFEERIPALFPWGFVVLLALSLGWRRGPARPAEPEGGPGDVSQSGRPLQWPGRCGVV